jgi:hypothetical protein
MIFTIGRMNPPTTGHQALIRMMMEKALEIGLNRVYVILSSSVDRVKNPLKCSSKRDLLVGDVSNVVDDLKRKWNNESTTATVDAEKIRECEVRVICMDDPVLKGRGKSTQNPILKCIHYILDTLEKEEVVKSSERRGQGAWLFVGEDRIEDFGWISKYVSGKLGGEMTIVSIPRPEGAISASYLRNLAIEGEVEGFIQEMGKIGITHKRGEEVYQEIRRVLGEKMKTKGSKNTLKRSRSRSKHTSPITSAETDNQEATTVISRKKTRRTITPPTNSIGYRTRSSVRNKENEKGVVG